MFVCLTEMTRVLFHLIMKQLDYLHVIFSMFGFIATQITVGHVDIYVSVHKGLQMLIGKNVNTSALNIRSAFPSTLRGCSLSQFGLIPM